ncbi:MAG: hypothetical protein ACAH83_07700 [Alphaproteobacteria bacterium]
MRAFIAVSILAALVFVATSARAAGCICSPDPFESRWSKVTTVFTGTVTGIEELHEYLRKGNANDIPVKVTLKVTERFKGGAKKDETFVLHTSLTRDTCTGHPFEKDGEYLVWAYKRAESTYESWSLYNMPSGSFDVGGLCGGTKKLSDAGNEVAAIRKKLDDQPEEKPKGMFDSMFGN